MEEATDIFLPPEEGYRQLLVDVPPPRQENSLLWWLAGISFAIVFLAITLAFFLNHST